MQFMPNVSIAPKTKIIPYIEGMPTIGAISVKDLLKANPGMSKSNILASLEQKYAKDKHYTFYHNQEEYFFSDSILPNINDKILEIPTGTQEKSFLIQQPFSAYTVRSTQFRMYMELKDRPEYRFGFDKELVKVEFWEKKALLFKLMFVIKEKYICSYYYNPHNLDRAKRLVTKYFNPMLNIELKI